MTFCLSHSSNIVPESNESEYDLRFWIVFTPPMFNINYSHVKGVPVFYLVRVP